MDCPKSIRHHYWSWCPTQKGNWVWLGVIFALIKGLWKFEHFWESLMDISAGRILKADLEEHHRLLCIYVLHNYQSSFKIWYNRDPLDGTWGPPSGVAKGGPGGHVPPLENLVPPVCPPIWDLWCKILHLSLSSGAPHQTAGPPCAPPE